MNVGTSDPQISPTPHPPKILGSVSKVTRPEFKDSSVLGYILKV